MAIGLRKLYAKTEYGANPCLFIYYLAVVYLEQDQNTWNTFRFQNKQNIVIIIGDNRQILTSEQ